MRLNRALSRTHNSILNLLSGIGGQLLVIVLKFVTRTVFIYALGKAYLGINGLFADILSMLSITELGIDTAINYQLYKPLAEHDDKRIRVLLKFYKHAYRVIGSAILLLGLVLIPLLPKLIKDYDSLAELHINAVLVFLLFLMQSVSSYWFFAYRSTIMKANQKKYILDIADYVITIVSNAAQIIVLILIKDFVVYTATALGFLIIRNFVNACIAKHFYPQFFVPEQDRLQKNEIVDLFKDCGSVFVNKVNDVVLKATDNIVLSSFIGLSIVGVYSNYLLFYVTIKSFLAQVYNAVKASMGNLFVVADVSKKFQIFQVMNFITVILYGTAGVGVAVCADELIRNWVSESYLIPQPLAILIGVEVLLQGLANNLYQVRTVSGTFRQMWYRPLLGIIINIAVSVWLVQVCGIYGVIIGTISSMVLTNILVDPVVIYKYTFCGYRPVSEYYLQTGLYGLILAVICAMDLWICRGLFSGYGWISLILHILIVAITVPTVFILLFWKTHECKYLVRLFKRVFTIIVGKLRKRHSTG